MSRPEYNLVFVFADQMRAEATGYSGNRAVISPNLDKLAAEGLEFVNCISGMPVCTPWRASMLTGQYPLRHGLFINDLRLPTDRPTFGTVLKEAGYRTGYIGKWHLDGNERSAYTPPGPRRQGFDFWAVANCDHNYMQSHYYSGDSTEKKHWNGYDARAQTDVALDFLKRSGADPFALFLSWGPPHNPYDQVPKEFLDLYPPDVPVRPNCPNPNRDELRGYYAHVTALDEQIGRLVRGLTENGQLEKTIFVFTSDHGDMLRSHGVQRKQHPWEESINVPFVIRAPKQFTKGSRVNTLLNVWDLMPTLLSLLGVPVPSTVDGLDLSAAVLNRDFVGPDATLAAAIAPFAEYRGLPWRTLRTHRHTYARNLDGPWLLYDNERDPYQLTNLIGRPDCAALQAQLDARLKQELARFNDDFQPAETYLKRWNYSVDDGGAIPIIW